ncbi:hypothetical protein [Marinobacterium litorale]|uniref:hypothetical protein n=1 Tax=Marinobacterium litorale TaxID=404770 RepID=UPI000406CFA5|nr:hypothetical protein [Marinobacterium litorale]
MKAYIPTLILVGMLGAVQPVYAQSDESSDQIGEIKKDTQQLLENIGSYTAEKKDQAVKAARESLDKLDQRIDALQGYIDENYDEMSVAARKEAQETMKALREQRVEVAEWYGSMKASTSESWSHMKQGFSDAYKDLANAWEKSEKEYRSDN